MKMLLIAAAIGLAGCAGTPNKLEGNALQQIRAGIAENEGKILFANHALWMPHSKEFNFSVATQHVDGNVVITEKSLLFQQWGGSTGLTTIKQISFTEIRDASIIEFGLNRRLVIRTNGDFYDSFSATDREGGVKYATINMYEVLSANLEKMHRNKVLK
jgi:hypothetical protein